MIGIEDDKQILDAGFRKTVLEEIAEGNENLRRRNYELKKHEIYRERSRKWVMEGLTREGYLPSTLAQMNNRATNIPVAKKIVNKLSQTYIGGATRSVEDEQSQESIDLLTQELDFNTLMIKADRYRTLFRNCMFQCVPMKSTKPEEEGKFVLKSRILAPWEYDVIEHAYDPTQPMVVIISTFPQRNRLFAASYEDELQGSQGRRSRSAGIDTANDQRQQTIADSPADAGADGQEFIWWSPNYHFTTNVKGDVIASKSPDEMENPIGMLPFSNLTTDQDGHFWAVGGESIVEGDITVNKMLTDINYFIFNQGFSQLVITGKNIPDKLEGGPGKALIFPVDTDDPQPQVFFASPSPNIAQSMAQVEGELKLILATNNLAPKTVLASDVGQAASGVALMVEQSEIMPEIQESQGYFADKEPEMWEVIRRWHNLFAEKKLLTPDFQEIAPFLDSNVNVEFMQVKPPVSDKERLEVLEKKKEMGILDQVGLIQEENPKLTEEEAAQRAEEVSTVVQDFVVESSSGPDLIAE